MTSYFSYDNCACFDQLFDIGRGRGTSETHQKEIEAGFTSSGEVGICRRDAPTVWAKIKEEVKAFVAVVFKRVCPGLHLRVALSAPNQLWR
jgi:hypothetical protein